MANCKGNGECYESCSCGCYDAETDKDYEVCTCGHRSHNLEYCRKDSCIHNCEFIKCKNFEICDISAPKWAYPPGCDLCYHCWKYNGEMKKMSETSECCICLEDKILVELSCHSTHRICIECWNKSVHSKKYPSECPLCRKVIGAWKYNIQW